MLHNNQSSVIEFMNKALIGRLPDEGCNTKLSIILIAPEETDEELPKLFQKTITNLKYIQTGHLGKEFLVYLVVPIENVDEKIKKLYDNETRIHPETFIEITQETETVDLITKYHGSCKFLKPVIDKNNYAIGFCFSELTISPVFHTNAL